MAKNLLVIAPSYEPRNGGVEQHIQNVLPHIARGGYAAIILVRYHPDIPRRQTINGVPVLRLPRRDNPLNLGLWCLTHLLLLRRADVVHSHDYFPQLIRRLLPQKRWVHTFHGYEGYPLDPGAIKARQAVQKKVDRSIGVGEFIAKWYGTPCDAWIYGAVDAQRIPAIPKKLSYDAVFYGRLEADTGVEAYLQGFSLIANSHPEARLLVVGSGSLEAKLKHFCQSKKLDVSFVASTPDVLKHAARARVAFVSGYLAILEASVMQKPIVAYYGTPIKKDYLEMHPRADSFAIASSPELIAEGYESSLKVSASQLKSFKQWSLQQTWDKVSALYLSYYQSLDE